jgi:membrane-associated phospholipid phosphatase
MTSRTFRATTRRPSSWWGWAALPGATVAVLALVALSLVQWVALRTVGGQLVDERVTVAAKRSAWADLTLPARALGNVSLNTAVLACAIVVGYALLRRGLADAVAAGVLILGANLTTQALKHVLFQRTEDAVISGNSLPSGHVTVVASLVLAALLVAPSRLRTAFALVGAFWIALIGTATILAGWHRLSDTVAAMLVSLAWASGVAAVLAGRRRRVGTARWRSLVPPWTGALLVALAAAAAAAAWALGQPAATVSGDSEVAASLVAVGVTSLCAAVGVAVWCRILRLLPAR